MTKEELCAALNLGRLSKIQIHKMADVLMEEPILVPTLLEEIAKEDVQGTFNASWVFDRLMRKRLDFLVPHIESFLRIVEKLRSESCMRPMAHVCQLVMQAYFEKQKHRPIFKLSKNQLERMVTVCFDWLIEDRKVATKVFAMTCLSLLTEKFEWIGPELRSILEKDMSTASVGYKSRAAKTLIKLNKLGH